MTTAELLNILHIVAQLCQVGATGGPAFLAVQYQQECQQKLLACATKGSDDLALTPGHLFDCVRGVRKP